MGYFIILRGPLGIGKTTISKKLSKILGAHHVSMDEVLEKNGLDKVDENAGCIPLENFIKADELILPKIREKLDRSRIVIFDGCFYHKKQIEHLISSLNFPNFVFTLKAPLTVCIERDSKRQKPLGQDAAEAVHNLVSKFDYGKIINAGKSEKEIIREITSKIPKVIPD